MSRIINTVKMDDYKYAMMNNGINPQAAVVVASIGANMFSIVRFQDAGYDKHKKMVWILAKSGSTNAFGVRNDELKTNPHYVSSSDHPEDSVYELFFFKPATKELNHVPVPNFKRILAEMAKRHERGEMNEYEQRFIAEYGLDQL